MEEGGGRSEMEPMNIDVAAGSLDCSAIFHVVTDVLGFILFMHQQIPSVLQDITQEFDDLRGEFRELELELAKSNGMTLSTRRKQASRKREVKMGIRRLEKVMGCFSNIRAALQLVITEVPVQKISLVLGPSPLRPLHIYELSYHQLEKPFSGDFSRTKIADALSRKAIRMLISMGAGSDSYAGSTKLFIMVKAPSYLKLPLHFLPKRDFRQNRKKVPFGLRFRCKTGDVNEPNDRVSSAGFVDSTPKDMIWFQCRHTIKGLACRASPSDD